MDSSTSAAVAIAVLTTIALTVVAYFTKKQLSTETRVILHKSEWRQFPLIEKRMLSPNTALYRFGLPHSSSTVGLPIGQHVSVRAMIGDKEVMRSYTPTSLATDLGYFDLVVKTYAAGNISKYFSTLLLGDKVDMRGPKGNFEYKANMCREVGMIAGGTGITPMLQVIQAIVRNPNDTTKVSLIFANVSQDDILLRETLDELSLAHKDKLKVYHVLNNPPPQGWTQGVGFVSKEMIQIHCPAVADDIKILMCGPPPMIKAMVQHCDDIGYEKARVISKPTDMVFKF